MRAQLRLAFQQQQQIGQRGFAGLGLHARMHRFDEGQIVRRVDGEAAAFARQRRIRRARAIGTKSGCSLK